MIRTLLIATALLTTAGAALANDRAGYGRVVTVEPQFSISFGTRRHDGFRVLYESGGHQYWTQTPYHPGHIIVLPPPPQRVEYVTYERDYGHGWGHQRGGGQHHDGWRDDRRDHRRHDRREHRRGHDD